MFQVPSKCVENNFSQFWSRLKWKSPKKMKKNSDLSRCSKIGFDDFFKRLFYVSFDICTTLIFLPTHSLMFGECFKYLQSVLKMIFHNSGVVWNETIKGNVKNRLKKSSKPILEHLERSEFFPFFEEIFISYDFRIVKIIFSTFWRYLKHSLNIKECVGIKISCTTRINENIKANVEKSLL